MREWAGVTFMSVPVAILLFEHQWVIPCFEKVRAETFDFAVPKRFGLL
jgi:hypothetical protein